MVDRTRTVKDTVEQDRLGYLLEMADGSAVVRGKHGSYPELRVDTFEMFMRRRLARARVR